MKVVVLTGEVCIRFRLRMCIWKSWKTTANKRKQLIQLGISKGKLMNGATAAKDTVASATSDTANKH